MDKKDALQAEKKFLSIQALAKRWNVSASTVRRIIDEGRLKGIRVRKSFKIDLDSALDYESRNSF